jgi:hypothetical protein
MSKLMSKIHNEMIEEHYSEINVFMAIGIFIIAVITTTFLFIHYYMNRFFSYMDRNYRTLSFIGLFLFIFFCFALFCWLIIHVFSPDKTINF